MSSTLVHHCRICRMVSAPQEAPLYDQIIFETANYFAVASLGGFIPGWVLVCSKAHHLSLASHYARPEFTHCVRSVVSSVAAVFGDPVVFEHGPIVENSATACGTTHAHLHVVPFPAQLDSLVREADRSLEWRQVSTISLSAYGDREYLYFANRYAGSNTVGFAAELQMPRSQFFRHVIASAIGKGELANYRAAPLEPIAIDTGSRLRRHFELTASAAA
jgi:diadenosine tetraphosphate (Ap4A) HIT family hydrolase